MKWFFYVVHKAVFKLDTNSLYATAHFGYRLFFLFFFFFFFSNKTVTLWQPGLWGSGKWDQQPGNLQWPWEPGWPGHNQLESWQSGVCCGHLSTTSSRPDTGYLPEQGSPNTFNPVRTTNSFSVMTIDGTSLSGNTAITWFTSTLICQAKLSDTSATESSCSMDYICEYHSFLTTKHFSI